MIGDWYNSVLVIIWFFCDIFILRWIVWLVVGVVGVFFYWYCFLLVFWFVLVFGDFDWWWDLCFLVWFFFGFWLSWMKGGNDNVGNCVFFDGDCNCVFFVFGG